jgi:hypothetical protein
MSRMVPSTLHLGHLALALLEMLLIVSFMCDRAEASQIDTLDLTLPWVYPIHVRDMKLVDFNNDGINEILVGFVSDSSRVGILDEVTKSWLWQSPAFNGTIYTVAVGDRNNDGYLDIICGGQRSDSSIGYIEVFDGPTFDSIHTTSGFDQNVLSAVISPLNQDSLSQIFLGTSWRYSYQSDEYPFYGWEETGGNLYILDGQDMIVESKVSSGVVHKMMIRDINRDGYRELVLGMDLYYARWSEQPADCSWGRSWILVSSQDSSHSLILYYIGGGSVGYNTSFDVLEAGSFNNGVSISVIGGSTAAYGYTYSAKLTCWNAQTYNLEWNNEWNYGQGIGNHPKDIALCSFRSGQTNAICVAYENGPIEFRNGTNGNLLAVTLLPYPINKMKLGNIDRDDLIELCVASRDSLYIYETDALRIYHNPVVSDIPDQTISEGEHFSTIILDYYLSDEDSPLLSISWSYSGQNRLTVKIIHRAAIISVPNPQWNGSDTVWFKACDPEGLCDSDQVVFTVTAVNDPPVISNIPDQATIEGQNFSPIHLDNYVTDPDDSDDVLVWSYWGETDLSVKITGRVLNVSVPNPEWNGSENIWLKVCDPGGLCDSVQINFTVIAVNHPPVVSDIPNQTISEGQNFAAINLNEYVMDADDPDSVLIWSDWGQPGLQVSIAGGVATITVPNPEWKGDDTIWFKVCDPGGMCDSCKTVFRILPNKFYLFQNYPNPFNPQTNIRFDLPVDANVSITIYSVLGEKVWGFERRYEAGSYILMWDGKNSSGKDIASGIYFCKISAGNYHATRKMILTK